MMHTTYTASRDYGQGCVLSAAETAGWCIGANDADSGKTSVDGMTGNNF
ncbi:MAG: hypothetical protein ACLUOF_09810 [Ruminococcus sp.]